MSNLSDKNIDIAAFCETWLTDINTPTGDFSKWVAL